MRDGSDFGPGERMRVAWKRRKLCIFHLLSWLRAGD
jgi:hypothetical protein